MAKLFYTDNDFLLGEDPATADLFDRVERIARVGDEPVLVLGETGVGKEGIAKAIHHNGPRSEHKLVVVNCATVQDSLAESEWFGHVKGAFTGAEKDRRGVFEEADGGTIFLDEIGDLSLPNQARLLRVLQEREVRKVGSGQVRKLNFRLVAATNKDLKRMIEKGELRTDLYHRLTGDVIRVPSLRERTKDIAPLTAAFVEAASNKYGSKPLEIAPGFLAALNAYTWPGNVRELRKVVTTAALECIREGSAAVDNRHLLQDVFPPAAALNVDRVPPYRVDDLLARILTLLNEQSPRTVSELARLTGRNEDAIRRHAAKLAARNAILIERKKGPGGTRLHLP
ncbi:MAG: sigma 54-interacting transcriptional regulator [Deltaproteobacteria bacterium]|nr:sigma 54-interacting transcriptional regulator [Deltaproteobacteria bacterium]